MSGGVVEWWANNLYAACFQGNMIQQEQPTSLLSNLKLWL